MSENYDSEQVLEGSGAFGNGDEGVQDVGSSDSDGKFVNISKSNGFINNESSVEAVSDGATGGEVPVDGSPAVIEQIDAVNQESGYDNEVMVVKLDDSVRGDSDDVEVTDDPGREDMFVDAPDELTVNDGRNADAGKLMASSNEIRESSEEKNDDVQENRFRELDNGVQDHHLMEELEGLRAMVEKTVGEKETIAWEYKEERETLTNEVANLCHQLKTLTDRQPLLDESGGGLVDRLCIAEIGDREETSQVSNIKFHEMISECSKLLNSAIEERSQTEGSMRELHAILFMKDQEIEDLNAKVSELLLSHDVVVSYLNSVQNIWSQSLKVSSEFQLEKDQHIEVATNRMLASLAAVVGEEELLDDSVTGKISHVEKSTSLLIKNYNQFLYEIDLLRQSLADARPDLRVQEEFRTIFVATHDELRELKRKEVDLVEKLGYLEDENRKLVEQLDKDKEMVETANAEVGKLKMELEQEKSKYANTKEKLSLAVTKGKALVQQRDSLRQSLADKTSELEKCLVELQEKSSALEAAELCKEELVKSENLAASLQEALSQRDAIHQKCQEVLSQIDVPEGLQSMDIIERTTWLVDERNVLKGVSLEFGKLTDALSLIKEELVKSENLVASLQEALSQRDAILEKCQEVVSQIDVPEGLQSMDIIERITWLVDERNVLKGVSLEFRKLTDALSLIDLPETVSSSELESRVGWLGESFYRTRDEIKKLQDEIARTREVAHNGIDRLTALLLAETNEKDYLQMELEDLACKYAGIVQKEHQVSLEKDQLVTMLLEASGITMENQEGVYQPSSDMAMLIDRCFGKIKEQSSASFESSCVEAEMFDRIQSLLYIRDQELMLCERILEEEMLERSEVNNLSNELKAASQELLVLKDEKGSLQKDLERAEEKYALLREKLSMAVKKGKGLVQDRENLKLRLDEKNTEIEKLKLELQQQESAFDDCRDQINRLSTDLERIPKLEADLVAMKDQRDQLEQFLGESNNMLQRVIESVDGIVLPVDSVCEEPVEKVKWLAGYFNEGQVAKTHAEQELWKAKEESSTLASKLEEAYTTVKSLEDALSVAENNVSQLAEENGELEVGKVSVEQELQKAIEELSSQASKFSEVCVTRKSLEDALSLAENNISVLINEKEDAQVSRVATETELEKVKEEVDIQTSKLAEAYKTIKSLEDALSHVETNVTFLAAESNDAQVGRTNLENEVNKLKEETGSQASKLADAYASIKSLEDALVKAENDISVLVGEKKNAEEEILTLNSRLNACMEELAGTHGSLESRNLELFVHLNSLQLFLKDETLLSLMRRSFEKKIENLKDMDLLLNNVTEHFVETGSEPLQNHPVTEKDSHVTKLFSVGLDNIVEMENGEVNAADCDDILSYFRKTVEGFSLRNKILADKFEGFSTYVDEFIAALLRKLQATRDEVIVLPEHMESLKQKVENMEIDKQAQENAIAMLENDITILLSACTDATQELQFEVENKLLELSSVPEQEKLNHNLFTEVREVGGDAAAEHQQRLDSCKYVKTAEKLLFATSKVRTLTQQFENARNVSATTIEDLQNKLKETRATSEKAIEERDLSQNRVSKLEIDVEASQNLCSETRLKLEDYQAKEGKLKEGEAELSSLYNTSLMKEHEAERPLLSSSQVKTLFDKLNGIEISFAEQEEGDPEPHNSAHVKKLFYIVDSVTELQHQMNLLSHNKEELQSTLATQGLEIEHLKEEVEEHIRNKQDSEKTKSELFELALSLEKIIQKLGGNDLVGDQKSAGVGGLLPVLEKLVMAIILESENSKSKAQELVAKLLGSQKVVDELSIKVKLLEDSIQGRATPPETVQERSIFEAPSLPSGSEISEIEDVGSLGNKAISPVPSAAHVRTLRKGSSTDHLALSIDLESDRLINNEETDEDKGHVFKSLNTSGLIPQQGKMVADRIDGIWVSGGRVLMSRPGARLGLIAYWLFLHLWLLGTVL